MEKALGSNHWSTFPKITGPLKPGFRFGTSGFWVSPVPELLEPTMGLKGKPFWAFRIPFDCQPLQPASAAAEALLCGVEL
jgi:hypothetical protein